MCEELSREEVIANLKALEIEDFDEYEHIECGPCVSVCELLDALGLDYDDEWIALEGVQRLIRMLERPTCRYTSPSVLGEARMDGKPWRFERENAARGHLSNGKWTLSPNVVLPEWWREDGGAL